MGQTQMQKQNTTDPPYRPWSVKEALTPGNIH